MKLLWFATPIVALAAWVGWRAARGRPLRRFALNAIAGITLLTYFAVTAGLGIFWVANQELPVFDPHYLFGYLTLLLVVIHVWINAPLIARFVRRRSRALSADGQVFRPSVAWATRVLGFAAFGLICFWIGYSRGTSVVRVEQGAPMQPAQRAGGMPEQLVDEDGRRMSLALWHHERGKLSRTGAVGRGPALDWTTRPEPFETYPSRTIVKLPAPEIVTVAVPAALDASRDAPPSIGPAPVTLAKLSTLLHLTQGVTSIDSSFKRRAAASSGALYPTVTHVVVGTVDGLAAGLYHYEPEHHALHLIREGDVRAQLAAASAHGAAIDDAPFTLVLSVIYFKTSWKYEERGYRYCLLDAGHVAANAVVAGRALELASMPIGRFDDAAIGALIGVDGARQGAFLVLPFGAPAPAQAVEPGFAPIDLALSNPQVPTPVMLAASRTALRVTGATAPPFEPTLPIAARASGEALTLPAALDGGDGVTAVIERRRSERRFGDAAMPAAQLATILRRAHGASVEGQRALRMHVVASNVDGVAAGVYEVRDGNLIAVRSGSHRSEIHAAALSQEVSERAAAVLVFSVDANAMAWPDASRGYRYGWLDAGIAAGRVYLQAVALGLGVSSIGAYFDDDVSELLRLDPAQDLPALLVALGTKP